MWIVAGAIASLIGGAMQYKAMQDETKRLAEETRRALERQAQLQRMSDKRALEAKQNERQAND